MESHEDDIFFLPRKFDDVVPSTPSSSSSSSSGIEEVKFGRVGKGKRTNPSILQDKPNRRPRGGLKEDSKKLQDNCSEDALDRTKKFHEFEGLLLKLEENRRRFKLLDEVDAAPCDPLDNSVQLASTNSENLDNIIVKLQSASLKEVFCIRRVGGFFISFDKLSISPIEYHYEDVAYGVL
ncbi:hypothetical protein Gasu_56030 isoform 1 [Galdieria sulphuraria]|uniref:Uncharacterized protein n=1 Tax=Galdieria sulphuraria TaxID=130081 RepID=M2XT31_GALSU|nr:hypothetical protein Gasu_56030 isoform 1 [Galdieria sulphuraria]EME26813.1 hypothetical protein isoform 1 [Galdieria sulphuraria]|eukprot:XP_005703333.1 hypothetical protein isoform 1 [Galdieria sulphuraria]